jgi:hypothetical protein
LSALRAAAPEHTDDVRHGGRQLRAWEGTGNGDSEEEREEEIEVRNTGIMKEGMAGRKKQEDWKYNDEECRLLRYKNTVRTSQETHYFSATETNQLMLCKI